MAARGYTALFFLDEATALAAGHRPCAECRWRDFKRFVNAWRSAHGPKSGRIYADAMDDVLHVQRTSDPKLIDSTDLVDGAMVADERGSAWLYWQECFRRWTPSGYRTPERVPNGPIRLLTPQATLTTLRAGYRPVLHDTVEVG